MVKRLTEGIAVKNVTLSVEEELLERSREFAAGQGTSLNGLIRQLLTEVTADPEQQDWFEDFLLISKQVRGDSRGWKFNRDEVYDGRL